MKAIAVSILISCGVILFSCTNNAGNDMVKKFDSVNQSLQKTNNSVTKSAAGLYKQLEKKWAGTDKAGSLQQLQYHIYDFYGYMSELKRLFYIFCGDTTGTGLSLPGEGEDNIDFTNRFFDEHVSAIVLPAQLENVQKAFRAINLDTALTRKIDQLTAHPGKEFNKGWFYNVPPVAALTMLSKFENDVRNLEVQVLKQLSEQ
jgi:GldM N-terminal domain